MPITKLQAQTSAKRIISESTSLSPANVVTLFEIELNTIANDRGIFLSENSKFFRFHNNIKLFSTSIFFQGKEYYAIPILASGFEFSSRGTLPVPKLSLSVNEEGELILALLKDSIRKLGDLIGAKVTRKRTFSKYLDAVNFPNNTAPEGFSPDSNAEFTPEIYYIDRKSNETKSVIEFELASILDVENIQLPGRMVFGERCVWHYRGEGCLYEYAVRRDTDIHGSTSSLPIHAPPVANYQDELIEDIISPTKISDPELYQSGKTYAKGSAVFITKTGRNYYFIAKVEGVTASPPNLNYWEPDECSKTIRGCRLRWANLGNGFLPFGGFPGVNRG